MLTVELKGEAAPAVTYPYVGVSPDTGALFLVIDPDEASCIRKGGGYDVGDKTYTTSDLDRFVGTVTLTSA